MRFFLRFLLAVLALAMVAIVASGCYVRAQLRGSLPVLDGAMTLPGLDAGVTVTRDALGVPTVTGSSRQDVARALGFLHAQDRFFQMDLQRRQPAGELAALVGARAADLDAQVRVHRFRTVARDAYARSTPEWQALLDAYAAGVNAGLDHLQSPPFEYLMLRALPEPWRPEDSILTVHAMFIALQGRQAGFEQTMEQLRQAVPEAMFRFLAVAGSSWDAPMQGDGAERPVPGPEVMNLRAGASRAAGMLARTSPHDADAIDHAAVGSNNWAVDGAHADGGGALLANDMHLQLGVPNIWYRASLAFPDPGDPLRVMTLHGVTLPGLPVQVVGSNGYVAWGFTNTGGDWSDLVRIDPDPRDATRYLTPGGSAPFETLTETIAIKGGEPRIVSIRATIWGPIVWRDVDGREYAQRWVAHDPDVMAGELSRPERVRTVDEMLLAAVGAGMPHQNVAAADADGRIGWSVTGALPRRRGFDGFVPESWADGSKGWDGYLDAGAVPRLVDPPGGRVWTANAPVVDGLQLALIGDGGYADGIRAHMIRDRLLDIERATPVDMLAVQLDDRAVFLDRWRELLLGVLALPDAAAPAARASGRQEFARLAQTTWTGRASPESAGYRLVRAFRAEVARDVLGVLTAPAVERDATFDFTRTPRSEGPLWAVVLAQPRHLLDPRYDSWNALFLAAVDRAIDDLTRDGRTLASRTWGEVNTAQIVHPLASAVPALARWLDMPGDPLPGDVFTPRAQSSRTGASERMVVSPGREAEGLLHMPTGQSAHPLSPFFGAMHRSWVEGTPVPLLPGPAQHTLTLTP